jgi:transposase
LEFKQEAVRLLKERIAVGVPVSQIGRELGVHPQVLRRWVQEMDLLALRPTADESEPHAPESETAELRRLRRENEILRQERDFLKKATAYFAKESH